MEETEQKVKKKEYSAVQVPVQYAPAIQTPEGEVLNVEQSLVEILNTLREIKKSVV